MIKKIVIAIPVAFAALLAGVLGVAAAQPDTFAVARKTRIEAPAATIFAHVNDLHKWKAWSPFEKLDPAMKRDFAGAERGVGAVYEWSGNDQAGAGRMEIVKSTAPSLVSIKLDFSKPFEAHNIVDFTLVPQGEATEVTWAMHGPQPFVAKVMCLFMSMDSLVGKDFEAGLASLKALAEAK